MTTRTDIYTRVTDAIIADLEKGVRPWLRPWDAAHAAGPITRPLRAGGQPYKGINVLMLWTSAMTESFAAPIWMTFKQAKELGASVKKGSKGSLVVYSDHITRTETSEDGNESERDIYFMKGYTVFNVEQIDGLPPHFYATNAATLDPSQRIESADRFFASTGADIRHGGDQAFYAPGPDYVQMPPFVHFRDGESYYATLAHEMTHWTRHPSRLERNFGRKQFGDEGYAREELVAEIGAAFLCCDLGITPETRATMPLMSDTGSRSLRTTSGPFSKPPPMPSEPPISCTDSSTVYPLLVWGKEASHEHHRPLSPWPSCDYRQRASLRLSTEEVLSALKRHGSGDWGDLYPEDSLSNNEALRHGGRLLSAYGRNATRFWVITEADRSVTTVLLPEDY